MCGGFVLRPGNIQRTTATARRASQLLEFTEPTTGVKVVLVGAMHYNPASIQLTADTIHQLAQQDKLGSVLIESCDIRWNSTTDLNPLVAKLLNSEMRTAHDLALAYGRPVVLGDQLINVTVDSLGKGLRETAVDLCRPGGWRAIAGNVTEARAEALPLGKNYLGLFSFLDPKLLLSSPISFIKYPLSYFVKSPIATSLFLGFLFWADSVSAAPMVDASDAVVDVSDLAVSFLGSTLELLVFARVFCKELLAERNEVLALNILEQCRFYQKTPQPWWRRWWWMAGGRPNISYAAGSVRPRFDKSEKTVVAVLGLAHCNGIRKLLEEQRV